MNDPNLIYIIVQGSLWAIKIYIYFEGGEGGSRGVSGGVQKRPFLGVLGGEGGPPGGGPPY